MRFPWQRKREPDKQLDDEETRRLLVMAEGIAAAARSGTVPPELAFVLGPDADLTLQAIIARALLTMTKDEPDADDAIIHLLEIVLARAPATHPDRKQWLVALFLATTTRHQRNADPADLRRAEQTAEAILRDSPTSTDVLTLLGDAYTHHFEAHGDANDLDHAVRHHERAVSLPGADVSSDGWAYAASAHLRHYHHFGREENVRRAVDCATRALALTAEREPQWGTHAVLLVTTHNRRYMHSGVGADLDRAIELGQHVLSVLARQDSVRSDCAEQLCIAHLWRYLRAHARSDLDTAVELGESALSADPGHVSRLANLANAYQARYQTDLVDADAQRAIELHRRAAAAASGPEGAAGVWTDEHGGLARNEPEASARRREDTGYRPANAERQRGNPTLRGNILSNLGLLHRRRYRQTGDLADLDHAIDVGGQALAGLPAGHPATARAVGLIAIPHLWRHRFFGHAVDPGTLAGFVDQVAGATTAPAEDRVLANRAVGMLASAAGAHDVAVRLLDNAVDLLPSVAPRHGGQADHEYRFSEHTGVVSAAVGAHCAVGDPAGAVRVAELGRGVLLDEQLRLRSYPAELDEAHPSLGAQLRQVREALAAEDGSLAGTERRRRLWAEHDELVARIRRLPGFERFLAPTPPEQLRQVDGHVVLVNAGLERGDAVIVRGDDLVTVPLPDLNWQLSTDRAAQLTEFMHLAPTLTAAVRRQRELPELLTWLWDAIVGPVLAALPGVDRVWWLPTGVLSLFPLHAASRPGEPGALDAVVSSYTASLRTLAHVRARPAPDARRQLLVALARTPGLPDLPGSAREAADLLANHPAAVSIIDSDATAARVLAALPRANWAHFACHAIADLETPSRGGLGVYDGVLPLPAIAALDLADAELAYLSACSTALGGVLNVDEALHLASAFQLAGFRHVIASLWPLDDDTAAHTAGAFYDRLPVTGHADQAAAVLREVTLELRERRPDRPDLWAPQLHYGL